MALIVGTMCRPFPSTLSIQADPLQADPRKLFFYQRNFSSNDPFLHPLFGLFSANRSGRRSSCRHHYLRCKRFNRKWMFPRKRRRCKYKRFWMWKWIGLYSRVYIAIGKGGIAKRKRESAIKGGIAKRKRESAIKGGIAKRKRASAIGKRKMRTKRSIEGPKPVTLRSKQNVRPRR